MKKEYCYIECTFSDLVKKYCSELVSQIVDHSKFYYSDVIGHIQGNVTKFLHFTLFFGLEIEEAENPKLKELVNSVDLKELQIDKFVLYNGYKNLYKILCLKVADSDGKLETFSEKFKDFKHDKNIVHQVFKPHITLAYVQTNYQLHQTFNELPKQIAVEKIKISTTS